MEEIKNALWDILKVEHIQTPKDNKSRLSENRGAHGEAMAVG